MLQSMGSQRIGHNLVTKRQQHKAELLQCNCNWSPEVSSWRRGDIAGPGAGMGGAEKGCGLGS